MSERVSRPLTDLTRTDLAPALQRAARYPGNFDAECNRFHTATGIVLDFHMAIRNAIPSYMKDRTTPFEQPLIWC